MYHLALNSNRFRFGNHENYELSAHEEKEYKSIKLYRNKLDRSLNILIEIISTQFLEVNIKETSNKAWQDYVNSIIRFEEGLSKKNATK